MVLLPCSKCCGPCWRCSRKRPIPSVTVLSSSDVLDKSEATGLPNGTVFKLDEIIFDGKDQGEEEVRYVFSYASIERKECPAGFQATSIKMQVKIGYLGGTPEKPFRMGIEGDDNSTVPRNDDSCTMVYIRAGSIPGETEKTRFTGYLCDEIIDGVPSLAIGNVRFEIDGIDLNDQGSEYQCFDSPPDEEGWQPVGDCYATAEECAKECGESGGEQCWKKYRRWSKSEWFCWLPEVTVGDYTPIDNSLAMEIDRSSKSGLPNPTPIVFPEKPIFPDFYSCANFASYKSTDRFRCNRPETTAAGYASYVQCNARGDYVQGSQIKECTFDCNVLPSAGTAVTECLISARDFFLAEGENQVPLLYDGLTLVGYLTVCLNWSPILDTSNPNYDPSLEPAPEQTFDCFNANNPPPPPWHLFCPGGPEDCFDSYEECKVSTPTPTGGRTMPTTTTGPGTHLKNMLAAFGIKAKEKGCGCKSMEKKMNRLGSACTEPKNLQMIMDHLQAEAKKRSLPFVRKVGEMLVKRAVRKSQQNS